VKTQRVVIVDDRIEAFQRDLLEWADDNIRQYPWRDPDRSLYEVFVAEFFLTQTPADNVVPVYEEFLSHYPTLPSLDGAAEHDVAAIVEPIGFHNMRAQALVRIAADYETIPRRRDALTDLPRVGPYVANATLCFALDERLPIVDRNVGRVYRRVFGDHWPEEEVAQWSAAEELLPAGDSARRYNLALLDFGATVCAPDPRCEVCFAREYCEFYRSERG
jgi:A/G-specific adenine glycosylase